MLKRSSPLLRFFARSIASNGMLGLKRLMHAFAYPFPFVFLFPSPYSRSTIRILARRIEEQNKYLPLNCSFRLYFEQKWIETSLRGKIISNSREVFRREGSLFRFFKRFFLQTFILSIFARFIDRYVSKFYFNDATFLPPAEGCSISRRSSSSSLRSPR